jgi:hypothetical protein
MLLEAWNGERRNDLGAAQDAYRRALELAGRIGFADHISFALVRLGSNALARGDTRQAEERCRVVADATAAPSSRLALRRARRQPRAAALRGLARLAAARGDDDAADDLQARAAAMAERDRASPEALRGVAVAT